MILRINGDDFPKQHYSIDSIFEVKLRCVFFEVGTELLNVV
jgi:hypothetical protein